MKIYTLNEVNFIFEGNEYNNVSNEQEFKKQVKNLKKQGIKILSTSEVVNYFVENPDNVELFKQLLKESFFLKAVKQAIYKDGFKVGALEIKNENFFKFYIANR